jgi:hypothetical protein
MGDRYSKSLTTEQRPVYYADANARNERRIMPTVLRVGPYRFFFYAGDRNEPPHIHVERDKNVAKFWLDPVRLQRSRGFSSKELNQIRKLVEENRKGLRRSWDEYFED